MIPDDKFLEILRDASDPVLNTTEVADELPIGRAGAIKRLHELADDGKIGRKRAGNSYVWWAFDLNES
jgi:hypothetical protein